MKTDLSQQTVKDFGEQWRHYVEYEGFWGSQEFLKDLLGPLMEAHQIRGARVADVGSGTGRTVQMLLDAGAAHVVAVEPSEGVRVLRENIRSRANQVTIIESTGEMLPSTLGLDLVISIGVLHHIVNPQPIVQAAYSALKPGGRILIWVYGKEGSRAYLLALSTLRIITTRLPHSVLRWVSWGLSLLTPTYLYACRWAPLPFRDYACSVFAKLSLHKRELIIYDQLNPAFAKYYTRDEVKRLLECGGFQAITLHHRHGCSWTALGEKH